MHLLPLILLAAVGCSSPESNEPEPTPAPEPVVTPATDIVKPEAGNYYRVRHSSGRYLTDNGFHSVISDRRDNNSQIVKLEAVEGMEGVFNIRRVGSGMLCGTDNQWSSTAISRDVDLARYRIVQASDPAYMVIRSVVMPTGKNCMGVDNTANNSEVYTDKSGADKDKHFWVLEEAEPYPTQVPETKDLYADTPLAPGDPRADAYPGYRLVFAQEFSTPGTPDHEVWNFEEGYMRNNEDQYYNGDRNTYIENGVLVIEGRDVSSEKIPNPSYKPGDTSWPSRIGEFMTWTSGSMQTKGRADGGFSWQFGIYEVRAKVPQFVGSWPAIWSTGMEHEWPYGGEIDLMEYYGNCIHGNVCWGDGNRWSGHWNSATVHDDVLGPGWGDRFHIWRMIWDYNHIEMWCDDILVNNIDLDTTRNDIPSGSYDHGNGCNPFRDVRQMLWLNLALGGNNGGSLANTPRPLRYLIDYARIYQKIGSDGRATYLVDDVISDPE